MRGPVPLLLATLAVPVCHAADAPPPNYVAGFLGTTLAYRPNGGSFDGWQHDLTGLVGYGRFVKPTLALELDAGPTYVSGDYLSFALVPGVVWTFSPHAYAAARVIVPVDPQWNLTLFPGIGLSHTFKGRYTPILELNLSSTVGRGKPDFGVALTAGLLIAF
jgi:hypothetical protein